MATFVLIHGGAHGGWCWEQLAAELRPLGHRCVAPDLPIDVVGAGAVESVEVLREHLGTAEDELIVVGHSLGGTTVPVAAALLPGVVHMVFLAAVVPEPGRPWLEVGAGALTMPPESRALDALGRSVVSPTWARRLFFHDCREAVAAKAVTMLRPTAPTLVTERCPIYRWPEAPATYIVCADDRCISPMWGRRASLERFGKQALELPGGHSPELSRPLALARVLVALADKT